MDRKTSISVKQFYDCMEEIAQILDKYQYNPIEDMSNTNDLIEKEKEVDKFIAEYGERPARILSFIAERIRNNLPPRQSK